jgi:hypothetical protein
LSRRIVHNNRRRLWVPAFAGTTDANSNFKQRIHVRDLAAGGARALRVVVPQEMREQGMPDARCTRGLACKAGSENAHEHTGSAENIRHSLRNGFTAYTRSPRRRIRLVTVVDELAAHPHPVGPARLCQLDTSNGCRNHTTSPYATTPFVCTPFDRSRVWLNPEPALQFTCAPDAAASTASNPASVTIAIRPSVGSDGGIPKAVSSKPARGIFSAAGLDKRGIDGGCADLPVGQINACVGPVLAGTADCRSPKFSFCS